MSCCVSAGEPAPHSRPGSSDQRYCETGDVEQVPDARDPSWAQRLSLGLYRPLSSIDQTGSDFAATLAGDGCLGVRSLSRCSERERSRWRDDWAWFCWVY